MVGGSNAELQSAFKPEAASRSPASTPQQNGPILGPSGLSAGPDSDSSPATRPAAGSAPGSPASQQTPAEYSLLAKSPKVALPNDPDITPEGFAMWQKFETDARAATAELDAASSDPSDSNSPQSAPSSRPAGNSDVGAQQGPTSSSSSALKGVANSASGLGVEQQMQRVSQQTA